MRPAPLRGTIAHYSCIKTASGSTTSLLSESVIETLYPVFSEADAHVPSGFIANIPT